jgi:dienelactone hydrolase
MTAGAEITEATVTLKAADGFAFEGFRASPKGAVKGGLIVLQEIFGLTDQLKGVVRAYARDGYDTIFPCPMTASRPPPWCRSASPTAAANSPIACHSTRPCSTSPPRRIA